MQISKTVVLDETDIGVEVWIELQGARTWTPHVFTFTSATSTGGPPEQWHELGWLCVGRHEDRDVWGVAEVTVEVNDDVLSALAASYEAVWDGQRRVGSWDPQAREQLEPILERLVVRRRVQLGESGRDLRERPLRHGLLLVAASRAVGHAARRNL
jgi:hypothetical protein